MAAERLGPVLGRVPAPVTERLDDALRLDLALSLPGELTAWHARLVFTRFVRPRVTAAFEAVGRGDTQTLHDGLAPHVHHRFGGQHALGGERRDREAVVAWAQRLHRLFPRIDFEFDRIVTAGFPWSLVVGVEWRALVTPAVGAPYLNVGAHVIRLRGARVVELHAYEDSQAVVTALAVMATAGVDEAAAGPITAAP